MDSHTSRRTSDNESGTFRVACGEHVGHHLEQKFSSSFHPNCVEGKNMKMDHIDSKAQPANLFTKFLGKVKFVEICEEIDVLSVSKE